MSTSQPVGFAMRFVDMESAAAARPCPCAVQQTDARGQFPIRAAPVSDPQRRFRGNESSDARGPRALPSGDLLQSPAVGIEVWQAPPTHHRIPRAPRAWRHRAPSACQRVESSLWARRVSIPGKDETSVRRTSAIQHPNLRAAENRAGVFGQFVLESHERWCSPHAVRFRRGAARSGVP